jgi:hypothetical protein
MCQISLGRQVRSMSERRPLLLLREGDVAAGRSAAGLSRDLKVSAYALEIMTKNPIILDFSLPETESTTDINADRNRTQVRGASWSRNETRSGIGLGQSASKDASDQATGAGNAPAL